MSLLTPPCPNCGTSVSFKQTQWNLGRPFECKGCKSLLVIPRNFWIGPVGFVTFWLLKGKMDSTAEILLLFTILVAGMLILSRLFVLAKRAD